MRFVQGKPCWQSSSQAGHYSCLAGVESTYPEPYSPNTVQRAFLFILKVAHFSFNGGKQRVIVFVHRTHISPNGVSGIRFYLKTIINVHKVAAAYVLLSVSSLMRPLGVAKVRHFKILDSGSLNMSVFVLMIVNSSFIITEFNTFFFFVLWMFTVLALFCDSD